MIAIQQTGVTAEIRFSEHPGIFRLNDHLILVHGINGEFRHVGDVGGVRQTLANTNQHAIPHDIGVPGFWLAGDTTWPGLGTVAGVLASEHVADDVTRFARAR